MEFDDHLTCSWSAVELINRLCCYCSVDCFLDASEAETSHRMPFHMIHLVKPYGI
ncbi:hypothetical protein HanHA300_Chr16g0591071 [Helianthus annuus]|nr:hypothetical protein HanHA300_Chr16g0591071 [Helianthus annuus]KAJ0643268.1 hypothetical protein HanOQP8_Chr16g0598711 [Helianthus annuus]